MKKLIAAVALTLVSASLAFAADSIVLPAKNGNVTLDHKKHQTIVNDCKKCHVKGPGKIEGFNKESAHDMCKKCHEDGKKGPTKCGECHKK